MDAFLSLLTVQLKQFVSTVIGPAADNTALGLLTWSDVALVSIYLGLTALANLGVAACFNWRSKTLAPGPVPGPTAPGPMERDPTAAGPTAPAPTAAIRRPLAAAIGRPLYILIWIYGIYLAATPVLMQTRSENVLAAMRRVMDLGFDLGAFAVLFWFLFRATHVLEARLALWASTTPGRTVDLLVPLVGSGLRVVVIVVAIILGLPLLGLPARFAGAIGKLSSIILIVSVAGLSFRTVNIFQKVVLARFDMGVADNLRARKVYTQLHVISRVVYVIISIFGLSTILMLFQEVRQVGTSLLASAGIIGIIAGFAAQKTLANLFAGFQIALAQPVRQDDVVIVEGEWGRVEEITLSYIVVHIWDDRRLVLPLSYFIEKPFQNWTRTSADLLGSVFVWVDYSFPVDDGRKALKEIIEQSPLWDKRFWNLQVSDATDKTMQLRVLATSSDSSRSWDLRCEIREKFIAYIQRHHPGGLPRSRIELPGADAQRIQGAGAPQ